MTFDNEDLQNTFHTLPTQNQYEWSVIDQQLMREGKFIHVIGIRTNGEDLQILVRIDSKLDHDLIA